MKKGIRSAPAVGLLAIFVMGLAVMAKTVNPGDVNGDLVVNVTDIQGVVSHFGQTPSSPSWDPIADANGDGVVNINDINEVVANFGKTYQGDENKAPVVNAGEDLRSYKVVTLNASASDDGQPNPPGNLTISWALVKSEPYVASFNGKSYGPGEVILDGADTLTPTVKGKIDPSSNMLPVGVYTFRITVSDGEQSSSDDVTLTVYITG